MIESGDGTIPVVVLAPHRISVNGALLADAGGTPVAREGERVILVGGFAPSGDPRHPAFLAASVSTD